MIKTENIIIENIQEIKKTDFQKGIFLCLFGVDMIPPHLGIIADDKYYSTSAKGNRVGESVSAIWRRVKQGKISTLFIKLNVEIDKELLIEAFNNYPKLKSSQTCLLPIKDYLQKNNINAERAKFVFELIPILQDLNLVEESFSLNVESGSFELPIYSKEDIANRIVKLQETC